MSDMGGPSRVVIVPNPAQLDEEASEADKWAQRILQEIRRDDPHFRLDCPVVYELETAAQHLRAAATFMRNAATLARERGGKI